MSHHCPIHKGTVVSTKWGFVLAENCRKGRETSLMQVNSYDLPELFASESGGQVILDNLYTCPAYYGGVPYLEAYRLTGMPDKDNPLVGGQNRFLTIFAPMPGSGYGYTMVAENCPHGDWINLAVQTYLQLLTTVGVPIILAA